MNIDLHWGQGNWMALLHLFLHQHPEQAQDCRHWMNLPVHCPFLIPSSKYWINSSNTESKFCDIKLQIDCKSLPCYKSLEGTRIKTKNDRVLKRQNLKSYIINCNQIQTWPTMVLGLFGFRFLSTLPHFPNSLKWSCTAFTRAELIWTLTRENNTSRHGASEEGQAQR